MMSLRKAIALYLVGSVICISIIVLAIMSLIDSSKTTTQVAPSPTSTDSFSQKLLERYEKQDNETINSQNKD